MISFFTNILLPEKKLIETVNTEKKVLVMLHVGKIDTGPAL